MDAADASEKKHIELLTKNDNLENINGFSPLILGKIVRFKDITF
jgi:hypothetical protein